MHYAECFQVYYEGLDGSSAIRIMFWFSTCKKITKYQSSFKIHLLCGYHRSKCKIILLVHTYIQIMGLNPPFGVKASLANKFIDKALSFNPKLLILIVPKETQR